MKHDFGLVIANELACSFLGDFMSFGSQFLSRVFQVVTIFVLVSFSCGAVAMESEAGLRCQIVVSRRSVFQKSDLKKMQEYPNWSRLEVFFENSSNWKLKGLFAKLTPQDLKAGEMMALHPENAADPVVKQLILDLAWFYKNDPGVFWSKDSDGKAGDLKGRILEALAKAKEREVQKPGTGGAFGTHPQASVTAMRESEKLILAAAVGDGPKQSHALRRWVQPLYGPVLQIIEFNNYIMRESKLVQDIDLIITDAIQKRESIGLNDRDLVQISRTREDTAGQLMDLQVLIAEAYGVDVAKGQKLSEELIRIYQLATQMTGSSLNSAREKADLTALRDLDRLDGILERRRKETNSDIYPVEDYTTSNLQTRYWVRSLGLQYKMHDYKLATGKKPGLHYDDSWTETTLVTRGSGKDQTTELVTTHHSETRYPSYENILQDSYYSRGSTTGVTRIREQSAQFRNKELSLRAPILAAEQLASDFIKSKEKSKEKISQMEQTLVVLRALKKEVWDYMQWNREAIRDQWIHDRVEHFRDRNMALYRTIENQIRFFETTLALLKREAQLVPDYDLPNREVELQVLRTRWKNSRVSQAVIATTAVTYGIAGLLYPPIFELTREHVSPVVNYISEATGPTLQVLKEMAQQGVQSVQSAVDGIIEAMIR